MPQKGSLEHTKKYARLNYQNKRAKTAARSQLIKET